PLYHAVCWGSLDVVQHLLHFGAEVDGERGIMGTALQAAASFGNLPVVKLLLKHDPDIDATDGIVAETSLAISAFRGHADMTGALLDAGADINKTRQTSMLHAACHGGVLDFVRFVIDHGANINEQIASLRPVRDFGRESMETKTVLEATFTTFPKPFDRERLEIVKLLIKNGAEINASSETSTSLVAACFLPTESQGLKLETLQILLAAGAEVNAAHKKWTSALEAASRDRDEEVVELLLSAGKLSQTQMDVALQAAVAMESGPIVRTLLSHGALPREVQEANPYFQIGELPLPSASFSGNTEIVDALIIAGENVDQPDLYGSPLESA
ncbi:ankyrin repeat-containing domain protein, partial [Phyllosticta citrichinensis]